MVKIADGLLFHDHRLRYNNTLKFTADCPEVLVTGLHYFPVLHQGEPSWAG